MIWILAVLLAAGTAIFWWIRGKYALAKRITDLIGLLAFYALFVIGAESVLQTLIHQTVFMTEVHQFLLNPLFLTSGGYLGPYLLARMAEQI